jgi:hypothetical protein
MRFAIVIAWIALVMVLCTNRVALVVGNLPWQPAGRPAAAQGSE